MTTKSKVQSIKINLNWCKRCGICVEFCPKNVYDKGVSGEPVVARIEDCSECRSCEIYCPEYAVTVMGVDLDVRS